MYKFIGLIPRRDDVTREFFADYYEANHAPLALKYFRGFGKYLRNHIAEEFSDKPANFDVLSEFWYESMEELAKTGVFLESELAPIIRHDENQFMNQPAMTILPVDEHLISGPERCLEPSTQKLVFLIKRPSGFDLESFRQQMLAIAKQQAINWEAHRVCCSVVQHHEKEAPWDAVLFVWPEESGLTLFQKPALIKECFDELCGNYLLLRTNSVETDLQAAYQQVSAEPGGTDDISL